MRPDSMVPRGLFDTRLWQGMLMHQAGQSSRTRQVSLEGDSWLGKLCLFVGPSVYFFHTR